VEIAARIAARPGLAAQRLLGFYRINSQLSPRALRLTPLAPANAISFALTVCLNDEPTSVTTHGGRIGFVQAAENCITQIAEIVYFAGR
jgi:hypothetical protein